MDKLQEIFERQEKYLISLRPTYLRNGFLKHASQFPWPLDDRHYQEEFRLLAWRYTEELIEATEVCYAISPMGREVLHEEVSDALHFFIELCIVSGVSRGELLLGIPCIPIEDSKSEGLDWVFSEVGKNRFFLNQVNGPFEPSIRALAVAMMTLRQRPWRVDHRPTDRRQWVLGLHLAFRALVEDCIRNRITAKELHEAYFKKASVNDQRREEFGA